MRHVLRFGALAAIGLAALLGGVGCEEGEDDEGGPTPENCSTGETSNVEEGETMRPGGACISCHASEGEGPSYTIAGTVMGALDDDENCVGVDGVTVEITGADGQTIQLVTNSVGNFFYNGPLAMPYEAKVVRDGAEKVMAGAQSDGECASCHTPEGAAGAPGRITAP